MRCKWEDTGDENMRKLDGRFGRGGEWGSNERDILVEGDIVRLGRNLVLVKFSKIHKDDTS